MKRYILLILAGSLITVFLQAQDQEILTNSSVIKMSKAKLSEELITDMISSSPVNFDLSDNALRNMAADGVSPAVIKSMKDTGGHRIQPSEKSVVTDAKPKALTENQLLSEPDQSQTGFEPSATLETLQVSALNYVAPLTGLIKFNEDQFSNLERAVSELDSKVRGYISDVNKVKGQIRDVENELRQRKNSDTKNFSADILTLKGKLAMYRKSYSQSKGIMVKGGENIVKNIEELGKNSVRNISKSYSEAAQQISSSDSDPASGEKKVTVSYSTKNITDKTVSYILYLTEMLAWYQNEVKEICKVINDWNPRVSETISEDASLQLKLEPLQKRLDELKANSRENKKEISDLKKQVSEIEKERKKLSDRMKDDAKELAAYIKQMNQKNQVAMEERFADIVDEITYSFGEKLSL